MRGAGVYGGAAPAFADPAALAELLRVKAHELAGAAGMLLSLSEGELHYCGDHAVQVDAYPELTRHGRAVWLVHQCDTCQRTWDVLAEESDESVIAAAAYPMLAVTACGLCCAVACQGAVCGCPCHAGGEVR